MTYLNVNEWAPFEYRHRNRVGNIQLSKSLLHLFVDLTPLIDNLESIDVRTWDAKDTADIGLTSIGIAYTWTPLGVLDIGSRCICTKECCRICVELRSCTETN